MKTAGILAIVALIVVLIYIQVKNIYKKVGFEFGFNSANLSSLNIIDLLTKGLTQASVKMSAKITNNNSFSISFKDFRAYLYYNNSLVAQTTDTLSNNQIIVPPKSSAEIVDDIKIYLNNDSVKLIAQVVAKNKPVVQYTVKLTIWGIPITWNDNFIWDFNS